MRQQVSAGAVIFRREADGTVKFLLLYHGRSYWYFPKGRLEHGERVATAFLREVEEETGIKRHELRIVPGFRAVDRFVFSGVPFPHEKRRREWRRDARQPISKTVIFYLAETKKREISISGAHEEGFGWFTHSEALRILRHKNTQAIIKRAYEFIHKNLPGATTGANRQSAQRHAASTSTPGRH
ncbi:MAG: NUDIX domain-containing protein [Candidatus Sungbacteria bacterium]|uniref:NUDIX domain-containing protein n=1 Tax=Candidatus Sungiibacteriota bacterium TaxID=2750080 RepID=A0A933DRS7_9BACT|nr:NUDIX domain-containing protein [Candidatus Sungbacteria bacterium]